MTSIGRWKARPPRVKCRTTGRSLPGGPLLGNAIRKTGLIPRPAPTLEDGAMNRSLLAFGWLTDRSELGRTGGSVAPGCGASSPRRAGRRQANGLPPRSGRPSFHGRLRPDDYCRRDSPGTVPAAPTSTILSVGTGVIIVASVSAGQFSPWQVSITIR